MTCTQFQTQPRILRTDNGREYINSDMHQFLTSKGHIHQTTCPDTPQQNGIAERKNITLLEITRAIMLESHVPAYIWPEAVATANYVTNKLPTQSLNHKTLLETLQSYITIPSSHSLPPRIFGCTVYVHCPTRLRNKLEPRAVKCGFLGYGRNQKGYRCFDPLTQRMYTTMDCDFIETEFYYNHLRCQGEKESDDFRWVTSPRMSDPDPKQQVGNATELSLQAAQPTPLVPPPDLSDHQVSQVVDEGNTLDTNPIEITTDHEHVVTGKDRETSDLNHQSSKRYILPPQSTRGIPPKRYDPDYETKRSKYPVDGPREENMSQSALAFNATLYTTEIPDTVKEALKSDHWRKAMEEEINALKRNDTWEKCILPNGKKVVGCRWVFTIKYKADGTIERHKARLVAKGYTQTYGVDYSEDDKDEIKTLKSKLFQEFEMKDLGGLKYILGIEVLRSHKGVFIS